MIRKQGVECEITFAVATLSIGTTLCPPRNLRNNLLHKFTVMIYLDKFRHIFQIANGIAFAFRKNHMYIRGKVINELTTLGFMLVDDAVDVIVQYARQRLSHIS